MPKKTRLPQRIVHYLRRHPTASRAEIAGALDVSYQAVQKHLRRMEEEGTVLPAFLVTERWDVERHEFWIFVETRYDPHVDPRLAGAADYQGELCRAIVSELAADPQWVDVLSFADIRILLGGNWDIVLRLYSSDPDAVGRFVTRYLRSLPAVVRTATSWALGENPAAPDRDVQKELEPPSSLGS